MLHLTASPAIVKMARMKATQMVTSYVQTLLDSAAFAAPSARQSFFEKEKVGAAVDQINWME